MSYDYKEKKIVAIIASNVPPNIMTNVIGHLAVSVGRYIDDDFMGRPILTDKSGIQHRGISKYPFITTKVKQSKLRCAIEIAREEGLFVADFPEQMLETGHDDELARAMAEVEEGEFSYLGAIIYGEADKVNNITGKFTLWRID